MNPRLTLNEAGIVVCEGWWLQNRLHRIDGPAYRTWEVVNGIPVLTYEGWWLQNRLHRIDGPAYRTWEVVNGIPILTYEGWWLQGDYHRVDGPALKRWNIFAPGAEEWMLHGKKVNPDTLHRAATTITLWLRYHTKRREKVISTLLHQAGMTVFPGLMQLLRL